MTYNIYQLERDELIEILEKIREEIWSGEDDRDILEMLQELLGDPDEDWEELN